MRRKDEFIEHLQQYLGTAKGNKFDKAAIIYKMIMDTEDPEQAFAYFLDHADYIDSSNEKETEAYFTASQIQALGKEYNDLIDGILNRLVLKRLDKASFYSELWETIIKSELLFEKEEQKIYALYCIWIDGRIPYFQIGEGVKMSDEEFKRILKETEELLHETVFIMNYKFEQKTERSSILIELLEKCKNKKEQSVVLAQILSLAELKMRGMIERQ